MSTSTPIARLGPLVWLGAAASMLLALCPGHANEPEPPADAPDPRVTLGDADLQTIKLEVMKSHPLLASSPGIKHVDAYLGYRASGEDEDAKIDPIVQANVVFHPHSESAGVRNALQAHCSRGPADEGWSCPVVELRRYVRLEDQEFEARVKGDLSLEAVLALVEATRGTALAAPKDGSAVVDTVSMILPCGDGYFVSWTDRDHRSGVLVYARLAAGGNPAERDDWESSLHQKE